MIYASTGIEGPAFPWHVRNRSTRRELFPEAGRFLGARGSISYRDLQGFPQEGLRDLWCIVRPLGGGLVEGYQGEGTRLVACKRTEDVG